jgi:Co/Zn/Cd efflux system component
MIIYFRPDWKIADPITTFVFAILVGMTTIPIFIDSMRILMEFVPEDLDVQKLKEKISECADIVDLHCWMISDGKTCLTLTIKIKDLEDRKLSDWATVSQIKTMLKDEFEITHSTIEI